MPLVASLPDSERMRLLRWVASPHGTDAWAYSVAPTPDDEFSGDPLAWEGDGREGWIASRSARSSIEGHRNMTITLDLPPNVEQAYLAMAQAGGLTPADVARDVLIAAQPATVGEYLALEPEDWVGKFQVWSQRHAQDDLPILSDEAVSRESIYEEA